MKRLPDTELEVMKALWKLGADTPRAALDQALEDFGWASNTVNTYLARLAEKRLCLGAPGRKKQPLHSLSFSGGLFGL